MLNLLERFDLIGEGRTPLNVHRMVEAIKCESMYSLRGPFLKISTATSRVCSTVGCQSWKRIVRSRGPIVLLEQE